MKIQIASFSASGGAGSVGKNLTYGFKELGIDASFQSSMNTNLRTQPLKLPLVTATAALDNFVIKSDDWPSLVSLTRDKVSLPVTLDKDTDAVILRWGNGLLNEELISNLGSRPLILGLDDMNYFTGACHYAGECEGFHKSCAQCPCVRSTFRKQVATNWERKKKLLGSVPKLQFVAPTRWVLDEFYKSPFSELAEATVIENPLDRVFFADSRKRTEATEHNPRCVLIMASNLDDPIKGVVGAWDQLRPLVDEGNITLRLVGSSSTRLRSVMSGAEFVGQLTPEEVMRECQRADLLLVPSLSETAGLVVFEAATQGVPTIARRIGGLVAEIVEGESGWLFSNDPEISRILGEISAADILARGKAAQQLSSERSPKKVAAKYLSTILG